MVVVEYPSCSFPCNNSRLIWLSSKSDHKCHYFKTVSDYFSLRLLIQFSYSFYITILSLYFSRDCICIEKSMSSIRGFSLLCMLHFKCISLCFGADGCIFWTVTSLLFYAVFLRKGLLKSFHLVETQEHSCQNDCSRMSKLLFSMQWQWIHTAELQKWPETSSLLVIISVWDMDKIFVIEKSEIKWNKVSCLPRKKSSIRSWSIIRFAKIIGQVWNYYLISNISHPFLTFILYIYTFT